MGYFGKAPGSRGSTKINQTACPAHTYDGRSAKDYADGGLVNTFRSDAEKKVDALYGKQSPSATQKLNEKIDKAGG